MSTKKEQSKLTSFSGYQLPVQKRNIFPFLELPAELRLQVYEYALPKDDYNGVANRCDEEGVQCLYEKKRRKRRIKGYAALLCTNKLIYKEALGVLYSPPPPGQPPLVTMHVFQGQVNIRHHSFFCENHHVYSQGLAGMIAHFRYVNLHVHAQCSPWKELDCGHDYYDEDPDDDLQRSRQRSLKNNLRWVVAQLRKAHSLSSMNVHQADPDFFEFFGAINFADDFRYIFQPLEAIRSLDTVCVTRNFGGISDLTANVEDEEWSTWEESYADYSLTLNMLMTSKEPAKDEPATFSFFDEFVHNLKVCELTGTKIDTEGLLEEAQVARDNADTASFISILETFSTRLEDESARKRVQCRKIELLFDAAQLTAESEPEPTE